MPLNKVVQNLSSITDYKDRIARRGTIRDSNIEYAKRTISTSFADSPAYREVMINSSTPTVGVWIVDNGKNPNNKKIIMQPNDSISVGDLITFANSKIWLVMDVEKDNEIGESGLIEMCNTIITIEAGVVETIIGYDALGRPVVSSTPTFDEFPCIVKSRTRITTEYDMPINLPDGRIYVSMQYNPSVKIDIQSDVILYGHNHKVIEMDYTRVVDNSGVLSFYAERRGN